MTDLELLNWAMHQMRRAARTLDLVVAGASLVSPIYAQGLDLCANTIEERLEQCGFNDEIAEENNAFR